MKNILVVAFVAATMVSSVFAACNNNCNGHGTCGANDKCTCYPDWIVDSAEDCSQRNCPQGKSRGTIGSDVHPYAECSNNGVCNRKTGECECYDGYTGKACHRSKCLDDCSGHGNCQVLKTHNSGYASTQWDATQTMICKCDPGYEGAACEKRMCPKGDDPLSLRDSAGSLEVNEIQKVVIATAGAAADTGTFSLKFTDWTGQVHETRAMVAATVSELEIKEALIALPNNVIPDVTVGTITGNTGLANAGESITFEVTFTATENSGDLSAMSVGVADSTTNGLHGTQPLQVLGTGSTLTGTVTEVQAGTDESKICAGRGICNFETGLCTCHKGFYGHSCDKQTALQ